MISKQSFLFISLALVLLLTPANCFIKTLYEGQTSADRVFKEEIWVNVDKDDYYSYTVYSQDGNIVIVILDENLKLTTLTFCKSPNTVIFIDAYKNFIIV
jgi:hypothetical protein